VDFIAPGLPGDRLPAHSTNCPEINFPKNCNTVCLEFNEWWYNEITTPEFVGEIKGEVP
jgi:hypothetical protein